MEKSLKNYSVHSSSVMIKKRNQNIIQQYLQRTAKNKILNSLRGTVLNVICRWLWFGEKKGFVYTLENIETAPTAQNSNSQIQSENVLG